MDMGISHYDVCPEKKKSSGQTLGLTRLVVFENYAPNHIFLYIKVAKLRTGVGSAKTSYLQNCSVKLFKEHFKVQIFKGR